MSPPDADWAAAERALDAFEAAWRAGGRPRAEDWAAGPDGPARDGLLRELVPLEVDYRRRAGEEPRAAEFAARLPGLDRDWLARLLGESPAGRVGRFELIERVGVGSFGAVWRARDPELGREVALKLPHPGVLSRAEALARFRREARAVAGLRHPGLAAVHEVADADGVPALVQDFIPGRTLRALMEARRLTPAEAVGLAADVADALEHAHRAGAVHRDVKPGNVVVSGPDAAGRLRPVLVDFGLVRPDAAERTLTPHGQVIGTPAYMSPEQARGDGHAADARSDVYSLGAVLYEMLSGAPPFCGERGVLLERVIRDEPRPPAGAGRDLRTVCLTALAKEPARRYASAGEFAADLRRVLAGEPVRARPPGAARRLARWARRHPAPAGAALLAVALGVALLAGVELRQANAGLRADADAAGVHLYRHRIGLASRRWAEDRAAARQLLDECPADARGWEWRYLDRACRPRGVALPSPRPADGVATGLAAAADGRSLIVAQRNGTVYARDPDGGPARLFDPCSGGAFAVACSAGGRVAAAGGGFGRVHVYDAPTGRLARALGGCDGVASAVAVSPDGSRVAAGFGPWPDRPPPTGPNPVRVWDAAAGRLAFDLAGPTRPVSAVAISPDGRLVAAAEGCWSAAPARLWLWDVGRGGAVAWSADGGDGPPAALAFAPDGGTVAVADGGGAIRLLGATDGRVRLALAGHAGGALGLAFSPDGRRLASAGADGAVALWDTGSGRRLAVLRGHAQPVAGVAVLPDGRVASAGRDQTVRLWDVGRDPEGVTFAGHRGPVVGAAFLAGGSELVSAANAVGPDGTARAEARVWSAADGSERLAVSRPRDTVRALAADPDGGWFALALENGAVDVRDPDGRTIARLAAGGVAVTRLAAGPGGLLACAGRAWGPVPPDRPSRDFDRLTLQLWDAPAGRLLATRREGDTGAEAGVAVSPDGTRVAALDTGGHVRLWGRDGVLRRVWVAHGQTPAAVASGPGGRLATAGWDALAKVWDIDAPQPVATLRGHTGLVAAVALSPDGTRVATGGEDRTVRVWDAAAGQELIELGGFAAGVTWVGFSPDGRRLAAASKDGTVRVWDAGPP